MLISGRLVAFRQIRSNSSLSNTSWGSVFLGMFLGFAHPRKPPLRKKNILGGCFQKNHQLTVGISKRFTRNFDKQGSSSSWCFQTFFIFISAWGFMIQFDEHIFQIGSNDQLDGVLVYFSDIQLHQGLQNIHDQMLQLILVGCK